MFKGPQLIEIYRFAQQKPKCIENVNHIWKDYAKYNVKKRNIESNISKSARQENFRLPRVRFLSFPDKAAVFFILLSLLYLYDMKFSVL